MKIVPIRIEEPTRIDIQTDRFALWDLGFRPFYLLASVFSAVSIALWVAQYAGWLSQAYLAGSLWHAHEMVFGYTLAVIVGFLFTAGKVWSGHKTPSGKALMLLTGLWLTARVSVLTPFGVFAAIVNAAFPFLAAVMLAIPLWRADSRRNYLFVAVLMLFACANWLLHAAHLGVIGLPPWLGMQLALDLVLLVMVVMAGRVIPPFSNKGAPGCNARRLVWLDRVSIGLVLAVLIGDALALPRPMLGGTLVAATIAHGSRLWLWNPIRTRGVPLVWILHVAYLWIVLHLLLRSLATFNLLGDSIATHALAAGAIGSLTLAMMTRTTKGHTGLPLQADQVDTLCYLLVTAAACVRVFMPLASPTLSVPSAVIAGTLWFAAFALFAIRYAPVLMWPKREENR